MPGLLITLVEIAVFVGLALYVLTLFPLPAPFAQLIRVVVIVIGCLWLLYTLTGLGGGGFPSLGLHNRC